MSFKERLDELAALGAEIARRRHQIGTLELERERERLGPSVHSFESRRDKAIQDIDRKLLAERLDLHLAETRRDTLRLEVLWAISDRSAGALLDLSDLEDVAP